MVEKNIKTFSKGKKKTRKIKPTNKISLYKNWPKLKVIFA
jgi:stalled ribosome rescue protein Dom34